MSRYEQALSWLHKAQVVHARVVAEQELIRSNHLDAGRRLVAERDSLAIAAGVDTRRTAIAFATAQAALANAEAITALAKTVQGQNTRLDQLITAMASVVVALGEAMGQEEQR